MVQVLYSCKDGKYPFGKGKETQLTYMEYLLQAKNQSEVNKYRQLNSIVKKISNPNIIKLQKVLKEDLNFHMVYEYQNKSLEQRLKSLEHQQELAELFVQLQNVLQCLIDFKLKAQLYLQFMGVDQHNKLKVWIKPDELQFLGNIGESDKKVKKVLLDYYETQRTRIHLEIEQIFETSELSNFRRNTKKKESQRQKNSANNHLTGKAKNPNFVIEGNTLVFLNKSNDPPKNKNCQDTKQNCYMNKNSNSKAENTKDTKINAPELPDLSKMSVAEKVLYYKKQKQNANQHESSQEGPIIVKDSSTSHVSQNDLSKSSNNDSNIQIKTEMINKNKMKIITSQEIQVEGNSDDDLQKLAREKIAKLNKERQQKGKTHDNSIQTGKTNTSGHSGDVQKLLKGLDENSSQQPNQQKFQQNNKQINSKIAQAKLKAKNILQKYSQKLKK